MIKTLIIRPFDIKYDQKGLILVEVVALSGHVFVLFRAPENKDKKRHMKRIMMTIPALACLLMPLETAAQTALTLEDCHRMAVENSRTLSQARTQVEMAGYDRKIALANYFPTCR